jgi:hypothetical protein
MIGQFKESGSSASGGFYDTPFGSSGLNQYWTVEGNDKNAPRWECGSYHKATEGEFIPEDENPNNIYTHHTIWFRGKPPTSEFVQNRTANRNLSK